MINVHSTRLPNICHFATSFRIYCLAFSFKNRNNSILQAFQMISDVDIINQQNLHF